MTNISCRVSSVVHQLYITSHHMWYEYNTRSSFPGLNRFVRYSRRTLVRFHPRSTFPVSIKNTFENGSAAKPFQTFVFNAREFAKLQGSPFVENLIRGSRGMDLDSKGKKKNNETCIRGSSLCSMPERNIRDERVEMWRIINATFFPFFMDVRPRERTLMISQGTNSTWRERERESSSKWWKICLERGKVKGKDWFSFVRGIRENVISKNCIKR